MLAMAAAAAKINGGLLLLVVNYWRIVASVMCVSGLCVNDVFNELRNVA
jgi:hypothetical protein